MDSFLYRRILRLRRTPRTRCVGCGKPTGEDRLESEWLIRTIQRGEAQTSLEETVQRFAGEQPGVCSCGDDLVRDVTSEFPPYLAVGFSKLTGRL